VHSLSGTPYQGASLHVSPWSVSNVFASYQRILLKRGSCLIALSIDSQ
jgi:hypothetical protein